MPYEWIDGMAICSFFDACNQENVKEALSFDWTCGGAKLAIICWYMRPLFAQTISSYFYAVPNWFQGFTTPEPIGIWLFLQPIHPQPPRLVYKFTITDRSTAIDVGRRSYLASENDPFPYGKASRMTTTKNKLHILEMSVVLIKCVL